MSSKIKALLHCALQFRSSIWYRLTSQYIICRYTIEFSCCAFLQSDIHYSITYLSKHLLSVQTEIKNPMCLLLQLAGGQPPIVLNSGVYGHHRGYLSAENEHLFQTAERSRKEVIWWQYFALRKPSTTRWYPTTICATQGCPWNPKIYSDGGMELHNQEAREAILWATHTLSKKRLETAHTP